MDVQTRTVTVIKYLCEYCAKKRGLPAPHLKTIAICADCNGDRQGRVELAGEYQWKERHEIQS